MNGTKDRETRQELPRDFLQGARYEGRLNDEQWKKLEANCSSRAPGPEDGQTTFIFSQWARTDHDDLVIIADRRDMTWKATPKPHCRCCRGALECECTEGISHRCGERFACVTSVCESEICPDSDCRLCTHEREECGYRERLEAIRQEALEAARKGDSIAAAHVGAVASVLAPGVGDAPVFPCTVRILDHLLGSSHDWAEAERTWGRSLLWRCSDGSAIRDNDRWPGWLEYEEAGE